MKIREIASELQFPEGPVAMDDGSVLLVEIARGTLTRVTRDGRVEVVANMGGGPNGAAMGPDGAMYVCNNGGFVWRKGPNGETLPGHQAPDYAGGRIERVNLATGKVERVYDKCGDNPLRGPNDLVFDRTGGIWFTDLGKTRGRDRDWGGIYYARADGSAIKEALFPVLTANGIGLSPSEDTVYFAETESARLWAIDLTGPGEIRKQGWPSPHGGRFVAGMGGYQRFDSLAVDSQGNVLVATLINGGITCISPDGKTVQHTPMPDMMTTNLCFGGADMRTMYVTLSGSGKLIAIDDWPVPGLRLNYQR